ncbi:MAG: response regulator [Limisphaerales bacterium]
MGDSKINVAVIDDEEAVRENLRNWLNVQEDFHCVGAWSGLAEMSESLVWKKPAVVLLDLHMGSQTGLDLLPQIKLAVPTTKVIILTGEEDYYWIKQALQCGADGYLLKSGLPDNLSGAVKEVLDGGNPLSGKVSRELIQNNLPCTPGPSPIDALSPREKMVLHELSVGLVYKEIAAKHEISLETVRTHARRIFRKLEVQNRTEAVLAYLRHT